MFLEVTTRFDSIQTCAAEKLDDTLQMIRPELDEFYERHMKGDQALTRTSFLSKNHSTKHKMPK